MPDRRFQLTPHLEALYRDCSFPWSMQVENAAAFGRWQQAFRANVKALLGIADLPAPALAAHERLRRTEHETYWEEKHALTTEEGLTIPLYALRPKAAGPYKAVLVFHGHSPSVQYVLGHYPDAATAADYLGRDGNYAQALAQAGYLVCAVEQRGFGERLSAVDARQAHPNSCRHLSFFYQMLGRTMVGERCRDGLVALAFMQQRFGIDAGRIGVTGNSGGGTTALWLGALDERLPVVVPGSYFCSFKASLMDIRHCECNYVPGAAARFDMGELAALIAPRPLRLIHGTADPIFPIESTRAQWRRAAEAYAVLDAADRLDLATFDTGHAYHIGAAREWFAHWL